MVVGKKWKALLLDTPDYVKLASADSAAEADQALKTIYIDWNHLNEELIGHELTHAYLEEMSFTALQLNEEQKEEFLCELNGKHAKTIARQATQICNYGRKFLAERAKRIADIAL
jgi:hypothetical protein